MVPELFRPALVQILGLGRGEFRFDWWHVQAVGTARDGRVKRGNLRVVGTVVPKRNAGGQPVAVLGPVKANDEARALPGRRQLLGFVPCWNSYIQFQFVMYV